MRPILLMLLLCLSLALAACEKAKPTEQAQSNSAKADAAQPQQETPQAQAVSTTQEPSSQPPAPVAALVYPDSLFDPGHATEDDLVGVLSDHGFTVNCFDYQNKFDHNLYHECQAERGASDTLAQQWSWLIDFDKRHRANGVRFKFPIAETDGLRKLLHTKFGPPTKTETDESAREYGATIPYVCEHWDDVGKWLIHVHICTVDSDDLVDSHVMRGIITVANWIEAFDGACDQRLPACPDL